MSKLVLWDIDGTLITAIGGAREGYRETLVKLGVPPSVFADIPSKGEPDYLRLAQIWNTYFPQNDFSTVSKIAIRSLNQISAARRDELLSQREVLPGVILCLQEFARQNYQQALLTGNTRLRAKLKLGPFGLAPYFNWRLSSFGDRALSRNAIAQTALRHWQKQGGTVDQIVVIGDTPADVACARHIDAAVVAVASGFPTLAELDDHQSRLLLVPSLHNYAAVIAWVAHQTEKSKGT